MGSKSKSQTFIKVKGPGLDLLEGLELRDRDKDYDGLLASGSLHLVWKAHWDRAKCG